jgi:hypothetical protein
MSVRRITIDLPPVITDTHCQSQDGDCWNLYGTKDTKRCCAFHDEQGRDRMLEFERGKPVLRLPECVKAEVSGG